MTGYDLTPVALQELAHNGLGCGFGMGRVPGFMEAATGLCAQEDLADIRDYYLEEAGNRVARHMDDAPGCAGEFDLLCQRGRFDGVHLGDHDVPLGIEVLLRGAEGGLCLLQDELAKGATGEILLHQLELLSRFGGAIPVWGVKGVSVEAARFGAKDGSGE